MPQELAVPQKNLKDIERQIVAAENRLHTTMDENKRLQQTRDALQSEIDKKTADYNIFMSQRDVETKKARQETLELTEKLAKDKAEFQEILKKFQQDKAAIAVEKQAAETSALKAKAQMDNIQQFIQAVSRAISVLGL